MVRCRHCVLEISGLQTRYAESEMSPKDSHERAGDTPYCVMEKFYAQLGVDSYDEACRIIINSFPIPFL